MGLSTFLEYVVEEQIDQIKVVDVGAEVGGGAWQTPCIKIRYRFPVCHAMYYDWV